MNRRLALILVLISSLFLSSCSSLGLDSLFPSTPQNNPYQINTFPIDGKYIEILGSNGHKISYYSYDIDNKFLMVQDYVEVSEYNFLTLERKVVCKLPTHNLNFADFQKTIIGVSYNQLEEPILIHQTYTNNVSKVFSVKYQQEHLLYSQTSSGYPIYRAFFHKPNRQIKFNYLLLVYPLSATKMRLVVDSIENSHLQTFELPKADFNWYETNDFIWFFSVSDEKVHPFYKLDKQSFSITKIAEYQSAEITGTDYADDYVLINNQTNNTIEIVNPEGVVGSIPCSFPQENINFVVSRKFQSYYSFFVLLRTTTDGIDTKVPWIRYYPATKKVVQKIVNLPENYEIYASRYYERKNDEFIALGMKQKTREMSLLFYYFEKGKIAFEPLSHRVDKNMTIKHFTYLPGYYFSWTEYTKLEKFSDFNYQVYYCNLNRLQEVVDKFTKNP